MRSTLGLALVLTLSAAHAFAAQDVAGAVAGSVKAIDRGTKTCIVKTADGTEHTFHFVGRTVEHGAVATAHGSKDVFENIK